MYWESSTKLSSVTASSNAQYLLENAPTARDAARLRSTTGKGAGAWLNAIPTSEVFALNSCDFCLASFLRLGLLIAFSSWTTTCNYGALIDDSGYHLLTCKTGGRPVWSHELISSVWSDRFRGLHIHHRREPRSRYTTTDNRQDIVFLTQTLETTLTLISPSPTHGVVTSFHHLLVLVVPLQRGEQTERKRNTVNSNYQVAQLPL